MKLKSVVSKRLIDLAMVGLLASAFHVNPSSAAQRIVVEVDHSQMISLPVNPGAVIVGNPMVADVSVNGSQFFLHGRAFGETNVIILDVQGAEMMSFQVSVKHSTESTVAVFKNGSRYSYSCSPNCESELQVGDDPAYTKMVVEQVAAKTKLATGSETSEAKAPAAPQ